jgi:hypothetical protein
MHRRAASRPPTRTHAPRSCITSPHGSLDVQRSYACRNGLACHWHCTGLPLSARHADSLTRIKRRATRQPSVLPAASLPVADSRSLGSGRWPSVKTKAGRSPTALFRRNTAGYSAGRLLALCLARRQAQAQQAKPRRPAYPGQCSRFGRPIAPVADSLRDRPTNSAPLLARTGVRARCG